MPEDIEPQEAPPVGSSAWLACVERELLPIFDKLHDLRDRCEANGERRVAWEITQGIRALDEARTLAKLYLSGTPLPALGEQKMLRRGGGSG